jgi:regulatory protein
VAASALTGLRRAGPGRVALEVDGRPWRTVPDEVVVRAGLAKGLPLDRPVLRRLRSELRRARARTVAARAVGRRELTVRELEGRLERAGVPAPLAGETVAAAVEVGLVDDARFAGERARGLADRGWGDRAVRSRLVAAGVAEDVARTAVDALPAEADRARVVAGTAAGPRDAARLLARRGFAFETIEDVLGAEWDGAG